MELLKLEKRVYAISIVSFLLAVIFSTGYHHFDEHFQILEFAGLKLNLTEAKNLPWEFREQMRPAIQPGLTVLLHNFLSLLGINSPFSFTLITRLISASLSFTGVYYMYQLYKVEFESEVLKRWFLYFSFFFWLIIYNGVRYSSENWSELFFLFAFLTYFLKKDKKTSVFLIMGLLLGFSFLFRYQTAFMTAGFTVWMLIINKEKISKLLVLTGGVLLIIGLGIIVDTWFYGEWVVSSWNYFEQNLLLGKSKSFGTEPWYWYFNQAFLQGIPPISILMIGGFLMFLIMYKKHVITWVVIPFLFIHLLIAHKEIRFLFPLLFGIPYMITKVIQKLNYKTKKPIINNKIFKIFLILCFVTNYLFLAVVAFKPADSHVSLYKTLYFKYQEPTTLYYVDKNPYLRVLDIYFYKREQLKVVQIEDLNLIPTNDATKSLIVFTNKDNPAGFENEHKLIYQSFPSWMSHFNFNNWMRRSKSWFVYEL